ncbi:hypothetical protein LK436_08460 [Clostridium sp. M62/1]|nr:hypothetical protein LK436_08460 [Clostridium sp. M62/1]
MPFQPTCFYPVYCSQFFWLCLFHTLLYVQLLPSAQNHPLISKTLPHICHK